MAALQYTLPFLTEKGGEFHRSKEERDYQFSAGIRTHYEVYLENSELNLKGIADFIIEHEDRLDVGEFKLNLPDPIPKGYILQLSAIALLAQSEFEKPVGHLLFKSKNRDSIIISFSEELQKEVLKIRDQIRTLMDDGLPPDRTPHETRCNYCEFKKICR